MKFKVSNPFKAIKIKNLVVLAIASILVILFTAGSASASVKQMSSNDIQKRYSGNGLEVSFKVRNNLWADTLRVTFTSVTGEVGFMSIPANTWGQWSNWSEEMPHPIYVTAEGGGNIYKYVIP